MEKTLTLTFHGKILDQLGYQTYQSPVASLSELVANGWDADAKNVRITIPNNIRQSAEIVVEDDGNGMRFNECQKNYMNVGYDRRGGKAQAKTPRGRQIMGRKGIGKFAGFGIAKNIQIETVSYDTGEKTIFEMDIDKLRSDEYIKEGGAIRADAAEPDDALKETHGTKVVLKNLSITKNISKTAFAKSLARRFLVHQTSGDFEISVNGEPIPKTADLPNVQFSFPKDYEDDQLPEGLERDDDGWGIETLPNNQKIRWRILFDKDTIGDEELQGVTIFANGKLVQKPFFFNLSGGLGGQHGQSYMFGQVVANYVDLMEIDPISAERQRVNWELEETAPLLEWGQKRVKQLLIRWHDARGEEKRKMLEEKVSGFSERLEKLGNREKKVVTNVLRKLGGLPSISHEKYKDLSESIITAWEGGRLKDLWEEINNTEGMSESDLLNILVETEVVSALNIAEAIKTKLYAIAELKSLVERSELENKIRDHLAENPWIISPMWETFKRETRVDSILKKQAEKSGFTNEVYKGRIDLALSSGTQILVLELMRPGLSLNWDHISRCKRYINFVKAELKIQTQSEFKRVSGYIIADSISSDPSINQEIEDMKNNDIVVRDWNGMLDDAKSEWGDYLHILVKRGGDDPRLQKLLEK